MTTLLLLLAFLSLVVSAFCSGTETGFLSVSRERILHLAREGGRKAKIVHSALSDMSRTTTTILIGNNLANVSYSTATAALQVIFCGTNLTASAVWSFLAAFLVLYFAEFLPKLLCAARPLRRILLLAPSYHFLETVLRPLASLALRLTDVFVPRQEMKYRLTSADLLRILQDRKDGVCLSDIESALIGRIVVMRVKGRKVKPEDLLAVLRET